VVADDQDVVRIGRLDRFRELSVDGAVDGFDRFLIARPFVEHGIGLLELEEAKAGIDPPTEVAKRRPAAVDRLLVALDRSVGCVGALRVDVIVATGQFDVLEDSLRGDRSGLPARSYRESGPIELPWWMGDRNVDDDTRDPMFAQQLRRLGVLERASS